MRKFKAVIVMAVCFTACSLIAGGALFAQQTRTCKAYYEVRVDERDGSPLVSQSKTIGDFFGKGKCRDRRVYANDCRRAARNNAHRCMRTHWNSSDGRIPADCKEYPDGTGVFDYNINDIKKAVESAACSLVPVSQGRKTTIKYSLFSVTKGDNGCGPELKTYLKELIATGSCECSRY